ncbi:MAG: hypothetical protein M3R51_03875 [Candidatus Eremiobacteraeota bacterium]|nr:hypothetical protein [Candidatus Eremiobacteraeota bacterium]
MTVTDRKKFPRNAAGALVLAFALFGAAPSDTVAITGATNATVLWIDAPDRVAAGQEIEVRNRNREFIPDVTIVPVGSSVRFPNDDDYYHSIYSDGPADAFDIGYYGSGPGKVVAMTKSGIVPLRCHIHAMMHAVIVVVDGPFAQAGRGRYAIEGVKPGTYTLHAWSDEAGETTRSIIVGGGGATEDVRL